MKIVHHCYHRAPLMVSLMLVLSIAMCGCAVREQFFGCEGHSQGTGPDEFVMTPTSLRFQSVVYGFTEERTTHRVYADRVTDQSIVFYPASGLLQRGESQWICKRIEP